MDEELQLWAIFVNNENKFTKKPLRVYGPFQDFKVALTNAHLYFKGQRWSVLEIESMKEVVDDFATTSQRVE